MSLPEALYAEWRTKQDDPFEHPAWGNLPSQQREVWKHVALKATEVVSMRIEDSIRSGGTSEDCVAADAIAAWRKFT